jgi:hypothetical protein
MTPATRPSAGVQQLCELDNIKPNAESRTHYTVGAVYAKNRSAKLTKDM